MLNEGPIIRAIADQFRDLRRSFKLLQKIDTYYLKNNKTIDNFLEWLIDELIVIFKINGGAVLGSIEESIKPIFTKITKDTLDLYNFNNVVLPDQSVQGKLCTELNWGSLTGVTLFIPIDFRGAIRFHIILFDSMPTLESSILSQADSKEFAISVANQVQMYLEHREELRENKIKNKIVTDLFEHEQYPHECWQKIVNHVSNFLPDWPPYNIEPPPLVQVLTYGDPKDPYITLQTSKRKTDDGKFIIGTQSLRVDETVCGVVIEKKLEFLNENPQKTFPERYKAFLFGNEIPQSELVIPIKHKGQIIGLLNLEHQKEKVFSEYHVNCLILLANFLSPFFASILNRESIQRKKEIGLQYVITNLLKRMGDIFQHKMGHAFNRTEYALTWIKDHMPDGIEESAHFDRLNYALDEMRERTRVFMADLPEFIRYSRVDICSMIKEALSEFDHRRMRQNQNLHLDFDPVQECPTVYGSRMIKEHIYNILVNACDAIEEVQEKNKEYIGYINISIDSQKVVDNRDNVTSPNQVYVRIIDNGGGMPPERIPKAMNFGFTTKTARGGNGFGLPAAYEYFETINGGLYIKNLEWEKGKGLAVSFFVEEYDLKFHDNKMNYKF